MEPSRLIIFRSTRFPTPVLRANRHKPQSTDQAEHRLQKSHQGGRTWARCSLNENVLDRRQKHGVAVHKHRFGLCLPWLCRFVAAVAVAAMNSAATCANR